jgi:hypothetical protein
MNRFGSAGIAGLLTAALAACSSSGGASTTPSPTPTPTPTVAASASSALPSFNLPSNAKELEALLPDTLGGAKLLKASMKGSDFVAQQTSSPELVAWLNSVGKSLNDVSAAYAFDVTGASGGGIFAFRVAGVDHVTLIAGLQKSLQASDNTITWTSATVGGKSVETSKGSSETGTMYLYGAADVIFMVVAKDAAAAAEALSKLP